MKQILIVEDDSFLNKMLAYNLTADGYDVTSALNVRTATEAICKREFDLVLLDVNLPDGNGFELCRLIKPQHPDTIVIFLTANDQESDQIRGYEAGAVDYITKPFVIGTLQRKIKAMFAMLEHHKPAKDIYDDGRRRGKMKVKNLSVKRLFGLLKAVGATQKQLKIMLNREIRIYLGGSLEISLACGSILSVIACRKLDAANHCITLALPWFFLLAFIAVLAGIYLIFAAYAKTELKKAEILPAIREEY